MTDKNKLSLEEKVEILLHIMRTMDEQQMITFAEDKFSAYFKEYSKPLVEEYLLELNNKKTLQFMIYGEPGMLNEHFIKVSNLGRLAREIKLQLDMIRAKHKDMILKMDEDNSQLRIALEKQASMSKMLDSEQDQSSLDLTSKVIDAIAHSEKLEKSLSKNKNLQVLEGIVKETRGYLKAVRLISEDHDAVNSALIEPLMNENRRMMQKLMVSSLVGMASVAIVSILIISLASF